MNIKYCIGSWLLTSEEEIVVPQMVGFEGLTKIIIGYLKVGADKEEKTTSEVGAVANIARANIARNGRFFCSIGVLEGGRGRYKLTPEGTNYAQSLDWGKLDEANKLLREILKGRPLVKRTLGFVDINEPVDRESLVAQIAIIAGVSRQPRYETGIRGFVDMLVTSGLLEESAEGKLVPAKPSKVSRIIPEGKRETYPRIEEPSVVAIESPRGISFPVSLNFNIDNNTNIENLKKILETIKEVFSEA